MNKLRTICHILCALGILFAGSVCQATEPHATLDSQAKTGYPFTSAPVGETKISPVNNNASLVKTFLGLTLVLGMIFLMAKIGKRFHPAISAPDRALKIVSILSLGTKEKVALIQVGSKQVLIGVTPQSINTLMDIAEPILLDTPPTGNAKNLLSARTASEFSRKLNEFLMAGQRNK